MRRSPFILAALAALVPGAAYAEGLPQLNPVYYAPEIVWLIVIFAGFYAFVKVSALPSIQNVFQARQAKIDEDVKAAEKLHEAAQTALKAYEATLAHARTEAQQTVAATNAEFAAEAEERKRSIEAELNAKLAAANDQIRAKREAILSNLRALAIDAAGAAVARILGEGAEQPAVARAVDTELSKAQA